MEVRVFQAFFFSVVEKNQSIVKLRSKGGDVPDLNGGVLLFDTDATCPDKKCARRFFASKCSLARGRA
jgi:hypothetical protein